MLGTRRRSFVVALKTVRAIASSGLLFLGLSQTAIAQLGSLNNGVSATDIESTERDALYDIVRFLYANSDRDFEVISEYYAPAARAETLATLKQPSGKDYLTNNANYIRVWQFGCLTCTSSESCTVDLTVRVANDPAQTKSQYVHWTLRKRNQLWVPIASRGLSVGAYFDAVEACPRRERLPDAAEIRDARNEALPVPKTWREQAQRADARAADQSVDEFSLGGIDF